MTIDGKDDKVTTSKGETNNEEDADLITSGKGINLYNRSKENTKKNQDRDGTEAGGNTTLQKRSGRLRMKMRADQTTKLRSMGM